MRYEIRFWGKSNIFKTLHRFDLTEVKPIIDILTSLGKARGVSDTNDSLYLYYSFEFDKSMSGEKVFETLGIEADTTCLKKRVHEVCLAIPKSMLVEHALVSFGW